MPVIPEFFDARYYLFKDGDLVFKTLPFHELDRNIIIREWKFVEIGSDPLTFLEFLKEAKALGATDNCIIRIAAESRIEQELHIDNVLPLIGIQNKKIVYEKKVARINPVRT